MEPVSASSGSSASSMEKQKRQLKKAFKTLDKRCAGTLLFSEFLDLLRAGNFHLPEAAATELFNHADEDLSGEVDFNEFLEFICSNRQMKLLCSKSTAAEEKARLILLTKRADVRSAASMAVKTCGGNWSDLTWKQRLDAARKVESLSQDAARGIESGAAGNRAGAENRVLETKVAKNKSVIFEMSQERLVDYSLLRDDLLFAGQDPIIMKKMCAFKTHLKTAGSPLRFIDVDKFVAKGTAGWVFAGTDKKSHSKVALKLIRMTQARSGIREWYMSQHLRGLGLASLTLSEENVYVLAREEAPQVIRKQLEDAGPCNYYMCLIQEFMDGGSLESLCQDGQLSIEMMFKALEDVSVSLAEMHANSVLHKDVKPENILLKIQDDGLGAARLCDFGNSEISNEQDSIFNDIRRFGITLYSVATGEAWASNRLIHADHITLVQRLTTMVDDSSNIAIKRLPEVLETILSGRVGMREVSSMLADLRNTCI